MALDIRFGTDTALLADSLAEAVAVAVAGPQRDPLEPITILVPNRNMEKWLRFRIARTNKIAANMSFPYLENGLWDVVSRIGLENGTLKADMGGWPKVRRIDRDEINTRLAMCLMRDATDPGFPGSRLIDYCRSGGEPGEKGFCVRLWQLACRLGDLFREYEFNRTAMVRGWIRDDTSIRPGSPEAEQARYYLQVAADSSGSEVEGQSDVPGKTLFQLGETVFGSGTRTSAEPTPPENASAPVFVFGLSNLSRYHCRLLWDVARYRDVRLFHFNSCREYWQDISTPFEDRWRAIRSAKVTMSDDERVQELELETGLEENALLKGWGRAGRETVRLLSELEDQADVVTTSWIDEFDDDSREPTILQRVQAGIKNRTSAVGTSKPDDSVQILACPGREREVETVAEMIGEFMRADQSLMLSDIVILVTDMNAYKPFISRVFDRDRDPASGLWESLPYNLADSSARADSLYASAVTSLLGLAEGDLSRKAVFELLYNPCFMQAAGVDPANVDAWRDLVDRLGVYHDSGLDDDVPAPYTWAQALLRLRLGAVMEGRADLSLFSPDAGPFSTIYPESVSDLEGTAADRFCWIVERLIRRVEGLRKEWRPVGTWWSVLSDLFDTFLSIPPDRREETMVRSSLAASMESWFGPEGLVEQAFRDIGPGLEDEVRNIPPDLVFQMVEGMLDGIPTRRGQYLVDGVTVATLKPMRPIPFRITFVLGLQEGAFPGFNSESSLDLRGGRRMIGDVTTPDSGRYMFLETLLSTTGRLVLTYDAWDTRKDERREPCLVVRQLQEFISSHVLSGPDGSQATLGEIEVELYPWSCSGRTGSSAVAEGTRNISDRLLAAVIESARSGHLPLVLEAVGKSLEAAEGGADVEIRHLEKAQEIISGLVSENPVLEQTQNEPSGERVLTVTVKELETFLQDPFKARLRRHFGIYDGFSGTDAIDEQDEPFELEEQTVRKMNIDWLRDCFAAGKDHGRASDSLRRLGSALHAMSAAPVDYFRQVFQEGLIEQLQSGASDVEEVLGSRRVLSDVAMGVDSVDGRAPGIEIPALRLAVELTNGPVEVDLTGYLDFVSPPDDGSSTLFGVIRSSGNAPAVFSRGLLGPFIFGMAARASEAFPCGTESLGFIEIYPKGRTLFEPLVVTRRQATEWLSDLVRDFLDDSKFLEFLPYAAVSSPTIQASLSDVGQGGDFEEHLLQALEIELQDVLAGENRSYYPPDLLKILSARLEMPDNPAEVIKSRYGLMWSVPKVIRRARR